MRPSRNAILLALSAIVILVCPRGLCQSRLEIVFTNRIVTFTNLDGEVTTDASLIRATTDEVVFKTNDLYGTVKFTNLAPQVLEYLGVPKSHLKLAHDRQTRLAEQAARESELIQAEQADLLDPANLVKVQIESVVWADYDPIYGTVQQCNLRLANGEDSLAFVARLPASVPDYLNRRQPLVQAVAQLNSQIETGRAQLTILSNQVNQAEHQGGIKGVVRANINAARNNLNTARRQLDAWNRQLKPLQTEMEAMDKKEPASTSVLVLPSHFKHNGSPMMICSTNEVQGTTKLQETTTRKKKSK